MSLKPSIKEACPADWNKMKIGVNSRFCESCSKHVVDFTEKSRDEILEYLLLHIGEQTCGHFYRSQLDYWNGDFEVRLNRIVAKQKDAKKSLQLLIVGAIVLSGFSQITAQHQQESISHIADTIQIKLDEEFMQLDCDLTEVEYKDDELIDEVWSGDMLLGMVSVYQVDAVFPGGIDNLRNYLSKELKGIIERDSIDGKVYVDFKIDKKGKVLDPKIRRGINQEVDNKVLEVIEGMPLWKPALRGDTPVISTYTIPIVFIND